MVLGNCRLDCDYPCIAHRRATRAGRPSTGAPARARRSCDAHFSLRRGGKWAREKFVMAVQGEFPRARGAGVPKGTVLCLGRVLDAHDEQDDAEGGHRDWEEDPLGFDTNPMLLRAMCMAFE